MREINDNEYVLIDIDKKHSKKSNKDYNIAYLLLKTGYGFDIIQVLIDDETADYFSTYIGENVSGFLSIEYNSYTKKYNPVLKIK